MQVDRYDVVDLQTLKSGGLTLRHRRQQEILQVLAAVICKV